MLSHIVYAVLLSVLGLMPYLVYYAALPKPIPGIPYNRYAAQRLLGDVPEALKYQKQTGECTAFLGKQLAKLNEPVIQLFLRPFSAPWVIAADFREAQDIMLRRTRDFDRSSFIGSVFAALLPTFQIGLKTGAEWKVCLVMSG